LRCWAILNRSTLLQRCKWKQWQQPLPYSSSRRVQRHYHSAPSHSFHCGYANSHLRAHIQANSISHGRAHIRAHSGSFRGINTHRWNFARWEPNDAPTSFIRLSQVRFASLSLFKLYRAIHICSCEQEQRGVSPGAQNNTHVSKMKLFLKGVSVDLHMFECVF